MDGMRPGRVELNGASLDLSYSAIVPIEYRGDAFEVSNLLTLPTVRRQNHANALVQEVCEQADQFGKLLLLLPGAFGVDGPSTAQLIAWYVRKFQFTELQRDPCILIRMPQRAANLMESRA